MWCKQCHYGSPKWVPFGRSTLVERIIDPETGKTHEGKVARGTCNQCGDSRAIILSDSPFKDTVG